MNYDAQLESLKNDLGAVKSIVIGLPANTSVDLLAASLGLMLSLQPAGKEVFVVTDSTIKVSDTNLFGIGQISSKLPEAKGGNLTLTLEGVVAADGTVPSLEKLDWFPEGANLNLVFHVLAGQKFEPTNITPKFGGGGLDLVITLGASSLTDLGNVYSQNSKQFEGVKILNLDLNPDNTQFGQINLVDSKPAAFSELVADVVAALGLKLDGDAASNLLTGIYSATSNLTQNVKPETLITAGELMQQGGRLQAVAAVAQAAQPVVAPTAAQPPVEPTPAQVLQAAPQSGLPQWLNFPGQAQPSVPASPAVEQFTTPPVVNPTPAQAPEEKPNGEFAVSGNPEMGGSPAPDWLTPKIFKGSNLE